VARRTIGASLLVVSMGAVVLMDARASLAAAGTLVQPYHGAGRFQMHVVRPCAGFPDLNADSTLDIVHDDVRLDIQGIPLLTGPTNGVGFEVDDTTKTFEVRGTFVDGSTQHATFIVRVAGCVGRGDVTIDRLVPPIAVLAATPTETPSPSGSAVSQTPTPSPNASSASPVPPAGTSSNGAFVTLIAIGVVLVLGGIASLIGYRRTLPTVEEIAREVVEADTSTVGKEKRKGKGKDRAAAR
jgi:hypothetical protein